MKPLVDDGFLNRQTSIKCFIDVINEFFFDVSNMALATLADFCLLSFILLRVEKKGARMATKKLSSFGHRESEEMDHVLSSDAE